MSTPKPKSKEAAQPAAASAQAAAPAAQAASSRVVYVGPTIVGVATHNTTYSEIPQELKKAAETAPYLLSLCVPIRQLSGALAQIRQQKGGIFTFYQKALGYKPKN